MAWCRFAIKGKKVEQGLVLCEEMNLVSWNVRGLVGVRKKED